MRLYFPYFTHPPEMRERAEALRAEGLENKQIAAVLGVGSGTVWRWLGSRRAAERRGYHARARALRAQGHSYRQIADALGVPKSTIHDWLS